MTLIFTRCRYCGEDRGLLELREQHEATCPWQPYEEDHDDD